MVASEAVRKPVPSLTARARIELLRTMMLARAAERRARALDAGEDCAGPAARRHSEPVAAGAARALGPQDRLIAPGRFRAAGSSTGRLSSAPDLVPIAVGVAIAVGARDPGSVVLTLADEGAMSSERWSEALALATAKRLPLVLVVERQRPASARVDAAPHQPLLGEAVDADDPEAVMSAVRAAVDRARSGKGPALVTCVRELAGPIGPLPWRRGIENRSETDRTPPDPVERYARRLLRGGVPRHDVEGALESAEEEAATWP
jgi:TPP-dependent pyruvate/acetoin dehydrogenase alpha subunit